VPERIYHPDLPDNILVSYAPVIIPKKGQDVNQVETHAGSYLLKKMAENWLSIKEMEVQAAKNEKPKAFAGGKELSVSFSHTNEALSAAISKEWIVGCDMEAVGRKVHPKLVERMKQPEERSELYSELDPIRIWTFKESALKMIGTGLRTPMKSVKISRERSSLFTAVFQDGRRAKICSFEHKNHWISICYEV
jgi:phosphopantetheinyl transferase